MAEIAPDQRLQRADHGRPGRLPVRDYLDCSPQGRVNVGARPLPRPDPDRGLGATEHAAGRPARDRDLRHHDGDRLGAPARPRPRPPCGRPAWACSCNSGVRARRVADPNLYTSRGDAPRPAAQWVRSLDVLRAFPADALAKSDGHRGRDRALPDHLRNYRDVIAWTDITRSVYERGLRPISLPRRLDCRRTWRGYETTASGLRLGAQGGRLIYAWYLGFNRGEGDRLRRGSLRPARARLRRGHGRGRPSSASSPEPAMADGGNRWAIELLGYVAAQPAWSTPRPCAWPPRRTAGKGDQGEAHLEELVPDGGPGTGGEDPDGGAGLGRDIVNAMSVQSIMAALPSGFGAELTLVRGDDPRRHRRRPGRGAVTLNLRRGVPRSSKGWPGTPTHCPLHRQGRAGRLSRRRLPRRPRVRRELVIEGDRDAAAPVQRLPRRTAERRARSA